jgi:hypothetical protein
VGEAAVVAGAGAAEEEEAVEEAVAVAEEEAEEAEAAGAEEAAEAEAAEPRRSRTWPHSRMSSPRQRRTCSPRRPQRGT